MFRFSVPCLGPRSTRSCGGPQTLEGAAREWEKFPLELKRAIPGYATDVFVMLELKTKLLCCFFQFQVIVYEKLQIFAIIYTVLINSLEY